VLRSTSLRYSRDFTHDWLPLNARWGVHWGNDSKAAESEELGHPSNTDANQPIAVQITTHRASDNTSASINEARLVSRRTAKPADSSRRVVLS
jgi:hypothetical protein